MQFPVNSQICNKSVSDYISYALRKIAQTLFTRNKKYTLIAFLFLRENPHLEVI